MRKCQLPGTIGSNPRLRRLAEQARDVGKISLADMQIAIAGASAKSEGQTQEKQESGKHGNFPREKQGILMVAGAAKKPIARQAPAMTGGALLLMFH